MKTHSPTLPAAHVTFLGLVQMAMQKISSRAAERRVRRQAKATIHLLGQLDARLLDDIGVAPPRKAALEELAQMNPAYLAASVFSLSRGRR